jgi:dolichyl-phosphate-mannose-protein mannosyltransferase
MIAPPHSYCGASRLFSFSRGARKKGLGPKSCSPSHYGKGLGVRFSAILLCAILLAISTPRLVLADDQKNLLLNGDFKKGSEDQPDSWRTEAWINDPDSFVTHWHSYADKPSEMEVDNLKANDGRWMQPLTVPPGWYQLSVDVRTENVGAKESGASMSVMEDGIMSADIHGTTDWQRVTLYLKVGGKGADIDVALRVGGFGSLNSGKAFFRNATMFAIPAPPPNATPTYDLNAIRQQAAPMPIGSPISLIVTFMALAGIALAGWRIFGDDDYRLFNPLRAAMAPRPKKR